MIHRAHGVCENSLWKNFVRLSIEHPFFFQVKARIGAHPGARNETTQNCPKYGGTLQLYSMNNISNSVYVSDDDEKYIVHVCIELKNTANIKPVGQSGQIWSNRNKNGTCGSGYDLEL